MYALHEMGTAAGVSSVPAFVSPSPGQSEPRAVESTNRGSLESEGRDETLEQSDSPVVRLIQDSAEGYAEMMEMLNQEGTASVSTTGAYLGESVGRFVDTYA